MTDEQRKQFIEEQIEIFPADCEMGEFLRDMAKLQPCEAAISRQAVLNILDDMVKDYIKENDFDKAQGVAWVKVQKLPSVSTEKTGQMSGAQYLEDIANGKFNEPYTCVSIKIGNETKHICVVNCSRICHNPRCACEKNKDVCPSCGARMVEPQETRCKMQIVITISEDDYGKVQDGRASVSMMQKAIRNGTPLPKGHGRLIDYGYVVDAIDDWVNAEEYRYTNATDYLRNRIKNVPTIIEADKGESEVQNA